MKAKTKIKSKKSDDYDYNEKYIKIKLNSDDESTLNKMVEIYTIAIVVRAFFKKNKK